MFSTLFPPPQKPPTSRIATPRGALYGRLRMRHARAVSSSDPDGGNRRRVRRNDAGLTSSESTSRYCKFKIKKLERGIERHYRLVFFPSTEVCESEMASDKC